MLPQAGWRNRPAWNPPTKPINLNRDQGSREYGAGLAMPLWLPGERASLRTVVEAESTALSSRLTAARLHMAGEVREAWWSGHGSHRPGCCREPPAKCRTASRRRGPASQRRRPVARRWPPAAAAVASAVGEVARARGTLAEASQRLRSLTGLPAAGLMFEATEPAPNTAIEAMHPLLRETSDRVETARRTRHWPGCKAGPIPSCS